MCIRDSNNSEQIDTTVNETLDPANQNSGLYTDVSGGLKTNISKFFELPEEERTSIISTLKNRQGLVSDSSWVDADLNDSELFVANQNIFKRKGPEVTDKTLKYLGVFQFIKTQKKPRTRIKLDNVFKELTGYSFDDAIESRIPREVVESEEFQEGLNTFYNQNKDNITIPEKSKLSPFTNQLQSFGYEVSGGVGLGIATAPMLKAGVPGVVLYAITNGIGNYLLNEEAQQIRKGQAAGIGEEGKTSEGEKIAALITGAIPFSSNATGLVGIRNAAIQGGTTTTAETTIRTLIEENRLPNAEETITALSAGTVFGGGFKGSLDLFSKFASKYAGKSAAQIDADLPNADKKKVNKMIKDLQEIKKKEEKKLNEKVARVDDAFDRDNLNINAKKEKPQINPEQVGDPAFTDARVQNLINKGDIDTTIKSRTETLDAAIELKNNPNFKDIVSKVAKDRKINPSDEFQLAIALEITSINNGILGMSYNLCLKQNMKAHFLANHSL